jgi:hypothetical protein
MTRKISKIAYPTIDDDELFNKYLLPETDFDVVNA